ncbi:MAG: alpha/beta fold hydrolase [Bacteroidetes bacterium]|nr:alpha/beta fold hydrolase [Bacteroidota bacterium]
MKTKLISKIFIPVLLLVSGAVQSQVSDSIVQKDLQWDTSAPAGIIELSIPSHGSKMAGFIYTANGIQKHPTLIMLHGFPGNERNLDLAQVVRSKGWNVIYFDYRGSWGSQGQFSFENCVEDVKSVVSFCKKYSDSLLIDTANMAFFGHSMGGFVCLKALAEIPDIKKGFALSTWDIYSTGKNIQPSQIKEVAAQFGDVFVLNTPIEKLISNVVFNLAYYNLQNDAKTLSGKEIIMLDEHHGNSVLAETLKKANNTFFEYDIWQTDHSFSNKRISLINKVLQFLNQN